MHKIYTQIRYKILTRRVAVSWDTLQYWLEETVATKGR